MADTAGQQPLVLVVDDEENITEMLAMGLGFNGFDVETGGDGSEALDASSTAGRISSSST